MCWCSSGVTGGRKHFANTRGDGSSARSSRRLETCQERGCKIDVSSKCVCVCVRVRVSLRLARSGDSEGTLEQFPKVCKLIRGLGFRV
jgi:hypothetical protein